MKYQNNSDGTITDIETGLMWQQKTNDKTFDWWEAGGYCKNLTLAGHSGWRLPTRKELVSLVDYKRRAPAIDSIFRLFLLKYWSSTTDICNTNLAWYVDFGIGYDYVTYKSYSYYVRAVRGEGKVPQSHKEDIDSTMLLVGWGDTREGTVDQIIKAMVLPMDREAEKNEI
uniref:Lcl C-terminal domain-containing protein n=1 Tax=viral metagenome TaxID=1070528 RepID=A0A6M3ILJ7_9ZZZZ